MAKNPFPLSKEKLLEAYRTMRTIREFEERLHAEFPGGGDVHVAVVDEDAGLRREAVAFAEEAVDAGIGLTYVYVTG